MNSTPIAPFIKWAGGKRQLLPQISAKLPETYNTYYEPFVGGGAVVFALCPACAVINDINPALVNLYRQIKTSPGSVIALTDRLDEEAAADGKACYYARRDIFNDKMKKKEFDGELAALFLYLNKHCFNGLYRVNEKGYFNVPYNNSRARSCSPENILAVSEYLQKVTIMEGDFQDACRDAARGDFVFFDSPYAPLNPSSFESYTKEGFDVESHQRLAGLFRELTERGCSCMLTNHNTDFINELYEGFRKEVVVVKRNINSDASKMGGGGNYHNKLLGGAVAGCRGSMSGCRKKIWIKYCIPGRSLIMKRKRNSFIWETALCFCRKWNRKAWI